MNELSRYNQPPSVLDAYIPSKSSKPYSLRNAVDDNSPDFRHSVKASMKLVELQQFNQSTWRCDISEASLQLFKNEES